ncbi:methionine--tRNA ligase, mitochondrial [Euwallacea similis]|uniref:methionine--tRNA ligase, mitochondrial n=1 Tax=Euwallacea similis TaxID=1736056 RepID=UPI00344F35B6
MLWKGLYITRNYSSKKSLALLTTPIYYVNAEPHIGHLYSSLITDAIKRWKFLTRKEAKIIFSTGTDEHGTKIQRAAKSHRTSVNDYCTKVSSQYQELANTFSISYTDFIRTSEERHITTVQKFWTRLTEKDLIYQSTYQGWYCVSDETFLSDSQLIEIIKDGEKVLVSAESKQPVEWSKETNYIFKLHLFKQTLIDWLRSNEKAVVPQKFYKILLDIVYSPDALSDISISRPSSRVHWGVPVPNDHDQTIYVWFDALVNYLTVAGYSETTNGKFQECWPPDIQVIGKDILKFHGVYWPAFLIAADLEPPRSILCHSHWTVDGEKMSKSKGNVVSPLEKITSYTADGLRYFLLREGVNHGDGNYSETKVLRLLNAELADTLGNLLSRCCSKALNPDQKFPALNTDSFNRVSSLDVTKKLLENIQQLPGLCETHYNQYNFYKAADAIIAILHSANLFFETLKPWELKKNKNTTEDLQTVLHLAMESLRVTGILLQPLIPNISNVLLNKLNVPKKERFFDNLQKFSWMEQSFKTRCLGDDSAVLFKRIVSGDSDREKKKLKN